MDTFAPLVTTAPLDTSLIPHTQVQFVINHLLDCSTGSGYETDWLNSVWASKELVRELGVLIDDIVIDTKDGSDKPASFWCVFNREFELTPTVYSQWLDCIKLWLHDADYTWPDLPKEMVWSTEVLFLMIDKNIYWQPIEG
jgi:hypothetical protein